MYNKYRMLSKVVRNMKLKSSKNNNLNDSEYESLRYIIKHNDCIASDIKDYLNVDKALLTRIVKKLETEGYITVASSEEDKRKKLLRATSKGFDYKRNIQNFEIEYYENLFKDISLEEQNMFFNTLEKIYLESKRIRKSDLNEKRIR